MESELGHEHESHGAQLLPPEERDVHIPIVTWTAIGLALFLFACMGIAKLQYDYEIGLMPKEEPLPFSRDGVLPPGPRLQVFPSKDLAEFRQSQNHVAESFGWVDKEGGIARIPVEKAMEMVLSHGLPVRTAENEKAAVAAAAAKAVAAAKAKAAAGEAKK